MEKSKKDYFVSTFIYQFVFCLVLFFSVYGIKVANMDLYNTINDQLYRNIDDNLNYIDELKENKENTEPIDETETKKNTDNNASKSFEEEVVREIKDEPITELSAKVKNKNITDNLPDNVSVNNYTISQRMVIPVSGNITSPFGYREHPVYDEEKFHAGVDIGAPMGTPVYASFSGEVVKATYDQWNGNYIKLMHDGDIMTVYCHCKELCVKKGDFVKAGDVIAYVGSTGVSTGPHLHFELRINNISYNPETAFKTAINEV